MTHMEIYQDGIRCHAALAQAKAALADTEKSLLASVEATVGYQHERDAALAAIARVEKVCDSAEAFGDEIEVADILAALAEPTE